MKLNSEYNKDGWGFIAKKYGKGVSGWKITKETPRVGDSY